MKVVAIVLALGLAVLCGYLLYTLVRDVRTLIKRKKENKIKKKE